MSRLYAPKTSADKYLKASRHFVGGGCGQSDNDTDDQHVRYTTTNKVKLGKLTLYDGGYDTCGAYWGANLHGIGDMYLAYEEEDNWFVFVRAKSRADAQASVQKRHPSVKFYRPALTISDTARVQ